MSTSNVVAPPNWTPAQARPQATSVLDTPQFAHPAAVYASSHKLVDSLHATARAIGTPPLPPPPPGAPPALAPPAPVPAGVRAVRLLLLHEPSIEQGLSHCRQSERVLLRLAQDWDDCAQILAHADLPQAAEREMSRQASAVEPDRAPAE